jgi:hypothetical protein
MKGVTGMFERATSPKLQREDSCIKKSMKAVMKRGKEHQPPKPKMPSKA